MAMRSLSAAAFAIRTTAIAVAAGANTLSGDEIRGLIQNRTVHLSIPYGATLPLRYASNREVTGDVSGITLARMFAPRETGKWWVGDKQMCQQWPSWHDGETHGFIIQSTGENEINWRRSDGLEGTARISG